MNPRHVRVPLLRALVAVVAGVVAAKAMLRWRAFDPLADLAPHASWLLVVAGAVLWYRDRRRRAPAPPERPPWLAFLRSTVLPVLAIVLFLLPVVRMFSTGTSPYSAIGGLLPWSDAENYYNGAESLRAEGDLGAWNERRPVNAALLATRLAVGGDLRGALLLQAGLAGFTSLVAARALGRDLGRGAGVLLFAGLYWFSAPYLGLTLSEALGVTLGNLAFAALWSAARTGTSPALGLGMAVLGVALSARAAALPAVPALLVWAFLRFRARGRQWRVTGAMAAGFAGSLVLGMVLFGLYGSGTNNANGNFSLTAYAVASGGGTWTKLLTDFPEARALTEEARNGFAYDKAADAFRDDPFDVVRGLWTNGRLYWEDAWDAVFLDAPTDGVLPDQPALLRSTVTLLVSGPVPLAFLGVLGFQWFFAPQRPSRRRPKTELVPGVVVLAMVAIGVIVAHPLTWIDGGERTLAPVAAFLFAVPALLAGPVRPAAAAPSDPPSPPDPNALVALVTMGVVVAGAVVGPAVAHALDPRETRGAVRCGRDEVAVLTRLDAGVAHVDVEEGGDTLVPRVRASDFVRDPTFGGAELAPALNRAPAPFTLALVYDLQETGPLSDANSDWWLLGPPRPLHPDRPLVKVCGTPDPNDATGRILLVRRVEPFDT